MNVNMNQTKDSIDDDLQFISSVPAPESETDDPLCFDEPAGMILPNQEYTDFVYRSFPSLVDQARLTEAPILEKEIKAHILGAAMARPELLSTGLSAKEIDDNLCEATRNFINLKNVADLLLRDNEAAKKNPEILLRNDLFKDVLNDYTTEAGATKFRVTGNEITKELVQELDRCGQRCLKDKEREEKRKRADMEVPENMERHMHARNMLIGLLNYAQNMDKSEEVKWQSVQKVYEDVRIESHPLHEDYLFFKDILSLDDYPSLNTKACKFLFGRSKTTTFLSEPMYNDKIKFTMKDAILFVNFAEKMTEENYSSFYYSPDEFEDIQKRRESYDDRIKKMEEANYRRRPRLPPNDHSGSNWREQNIHSITSMFNKNPKSYSNNRNKNGCQEEVCYIDKDNLTAPWGAEVKNQSDNEYDKPPLSSDDEDDDMPETQFSDEDEEISKEKELKRQKRIKRNEEKEEKRRQLAEAHESQSRSPIKEPVDSPTKNEEVITHSNVINQWEEAVDNDTISDSFSKPILPRASVSEAVRSFGVSNLGKTKEVSSTRTFVPESKYSPTKSTTGIRTGVKSAFGGPVQSLSRPVSSLSKSDDYKRVEQFSSQQQTGPSRQSISPSVRQLSPASVASSSSSISQMNNSTYSIKPTIDQERDNFINFLRNYVHAFRGDEAKHMRLFSIMSLSSFPQPYQLFGMNFKSAIEERVPEIKFEEVETENGFDMIMRWVAN